VFTGNLLRQLWHEFCTAHEVYKTIFQKQILQGTLSQELLAEGFQSSFKGRPCKESKLQIFLQSTELFARAFKGSFKDRPCKEFKLEVFLQSIEVCKKTFEIEGSAAILSRRVRRRTSLGRLALIHVHSSKRSLAVAQGSRHPRG
jgi:hypothetical protein